jgi:hypothetical protein
LVIEPIVEGTLLAQTLIDRGSGLNVLFVDTLKKMDFDFRRLVSATSLSSASCPVRRPTP